MINTSGRSIAWIRGADVYDYAGRHLGWWHTDHMRERDGAVSVWLRGARPGVMLPIPRIPPIPPIATIEPLRPLPQLPPLRPINRMGWSAFEFGRPHPG
jgi:hypothetical protein